MDLGLQIKMDVSYQLEVPSCNDPLLLVANAGVSIEPYGVGVSAV